MAQDFSIQDLQKLDNVKLYDLCRKYGKQTLLWRQKFTGLLPEVFRRKLYEQKGFKDIFEFAAKLAGISHDQVCLVLNLEKTFADKPILQKILIEGEVSINKLSRITSIATIENQEFLANQVQLLSNRSLETLVKDIKISDQDLKNEEQYGLFKTGNELKSLHVQTENMPSLLAQFPKLLDQNGQSLELKISSENFQRLLALQNKGIDINKLIEEFLQKREEEIAIEKEQLAEQDLQKQQKRSLEGKKPSRYITKKTHELLQKEYGTKCQKENCNNAAINIHHKERFALCQNNDPHQLNQFCKAHHQIAHSIDVKFHEIRFSAINNKTEIFSG